MKISTCQNTFLSIRCPVDDNENKHIRLNWTFIEKIFLLFFSQVTTKTVNIHVRTSVATLKKQQNHMNSPI